MLIIKRMTIIFLILSLSLTMVAAQDDEHSTNDEDMMSESALSNTAILGISLGLGLITSGAAWLIARKRLHILYYAINTLLIITAFIHILYTWTEDLLLLANGIGYLGLAILYLIPITAKQPYKRILNGVTIIYTLITIIGYFVLHASGHLDLIGLFTKAVEIALLGAIAMYMFVKPGDLARK